MVLLYWLFQSESTCSESLRTSTPTSTMPSLPKEFPVTPIVDNKQMKENVPPMAFTTIQKQSTKNWIHSFKLPERVSGYIVIGGYGDDNMQILFITFL